MRLFKNGDELQGTPEEISQFLSLVAEPTGREVDDTFDISDFDERNEPLIDEVEHSKKLREELSKDPNYNPYGGVVPPKDSETLVDAENDTGVTIG